MLSLFCDRRLVLLLPLFLHSNWFFPYHFGVFNAGSSSTTAHSSLAQTHTRSLFLSCIVHTTHASTHDTTQSPSRPFPGSSPTFDFSLENMALSLFTHVCAHYDCCTSPAQVFSTQERKAGILRGTGAVKWLGCVHYTNMHCCYHCYYTCMCSFCVKKFERERVCMCVCVRVCVSVSVCVRTCMRACVCVWGRDGKAVLVYADMQDRAMPARTMRIGNTRYVTHVTAALITRR